VRTRASNARFSVHVLCAAICAYTLHRFDSAQTCVTRVIQTMTVIEGVKREHEC